MPYFDIRNQIDRDIRHCRTRAFGARLFAAYPRSASASILWNEVAVAWEELARLKEQVAATNARIDGAQARLTAGKDEKAPTAPR